MQIRITIPEQVYDVDIDPEDEADVAAGEIDYDCYIHHYIVDPDYTVEVIQ